MYFRAAAKAHVHYLKNMKKTAIIVFRVLIGLVLIGKISNWFLDYSDETNKILNTAMFCLIGIAYIFVGITWDKKWMKLVFIVCGLYLIVMNFLEPHVMLSIIGILCTLIPILIARFLPAEKELEVK